MNIAHRPQKNDILPTYEYWLEARFNGKLLPHGLGYCGAFWKKSTIGAFNIDPTGC